MMQLYDDMKQMGGEIDTHYRLPWMRR